MTHYKLILVADDGTVLDSWHTWTDHPHPTPDSVRWQDFGPHPYEQDRMFPNESVCATCGDQVDAVQHNQGAF